MPIIYKTISSMEKCFLDEDIAQKKELTVGCALRGEEFAFEIAYTSTFNHKYGFHINISSELKEYIAIRSIESIPVRLPCYPYSDDNYIRKTPGLYPDLLAPLDPTGICYATAGQLKSLYVTVNIPVTIQSGDYPIVIRFTSQDGMEEERIFTIHVLDAILPPQKLIVTQWFHADCLADYYGYETFSEAHWSCIKNFMDTAVKNGINMILTPVFTPPLDTAIGGERRTTQLVEVIETENGWEFNFTKLERWVQVAQSVGIKYFEISHLYTQWGAEHAPKIMGTDRNGRYHKLFGWETDSCSPEYCSFLRSFLQNLVHKMKELGVDQQCYYHISDEPRFEHLETYQRVKAQIEDILEDYTIMDALSNFDFYQTGAVEFPIPSTNHIEPFLEAKIPGLWTYYCCSQNVDVSNRFLAMSMARTRMIGIQLWKYRIAGFLQWGYNFYNTQYSTRNINPYLITDGEYWVPAGDAFSVYPGQGGIALESLHLKGFTMALQDLRVLCYAEEKFGREKILEIIDRVEPITFSRYPRDDEWLIGIRNELNQLLMS